MRTLYTIGHSTNTIETFMQLICKYSINCIVDVRSTPFSKFTPQFNKEILKTELSKRNIQYIHMGDEFGARRNNKSLYDNEGKLDFEKTSKSKEFIDGVERVKKGVEKGYRLAFMCSEKNPIECHRCILVGREFQKIGFTVENIMPDGNLLNQNEVTKLLLDKYYPDRNQLSFFSSLEQDYENSAYKKQARLIAYDLHNDMEEIEV